MKKFIFYMVLILLLATVPAALAAGEYAAYSNAAYGYTVQYPAGWMALSADTLGPMIQQFTGENASVFGTDAMDGFESDMSVDAAGIAVFLDVSGNSFSVIPFAFLTADSMQEAHDALSTELASAYQQNLDGVTVVDSGSVVAIGSNEFIRVRLEYAADGQTMVITSFFNFQNNVMFQLSFTWLTAGESDVQALDQIMETVVASFNVA